MTEVGIVGWGLYVPRYRLTGELLKVAWGSGGKGARAVANHDEDTITMAVEAVSSAVEGTGRSAIPEALLFASTSPVFEDGLNSASVALASDLPETLSAMDLAGSVRSGAAALLAASDAVVSGRVRLAAAVGSEVSVAQPGSPEEATAGDGAAALLVGSSELAARLLGTHSVTRDVRDVWRLRGERFSRSSETKFVQDYGYPQAMKAAVDGLLGKLGLGKDAVSRLAFASPDPRTAKVIGQALGFSPERLPASQPTDAVGDLGAAGFLANLAGALDQAKVGEKILAVGYGGGADAFLFESLRDGTGKSVARAVARAKPLSRYERYLVLRRLVPCEDPIRAWTSPIVLLREQSSLYRLQGQRCLGCGAVQYPPRFVCWKCGSREKFETISLRKRGKVYTFTKDHLVPTPEPPVVMMAVELEGGGRFYGQLTDCDPGEVAIGMEVQMTFRRLHEGGDYPNYFWKFRPVVEA